LGRARKPFAVQPFRMEERQAGIHHCPAIRLCLPGFGLPSCARVVGEQYQNVRTLMRRTCARAGSTRRSPGHKPPCRSRVAVGRHGSKHEEEGDGEAWSIGP
jgi:hypothetical protein